MIVITIPEEIAKGAVESYGKYQDHAAIECDPNKNLEAVIDVLIFALKEEKND